jgi:hypothetical protein
MVRYRDFPTHTTDVLDLTTVTVDELAVLVPPLRRRSWRTWPNDPCREDAGRRDATRPIGTVPCRQRKICCCSC